MNTKKRLLKLITISTALLVGLGLAIHQNKSVTKVVADQHLDNYALYTYEGDYYDGFNFDAAGGMNGALRTSLTTLIRPVGFYTYGSSGETHLSTQLQYADEDPTNSNNMVYFYTRDSVTKNAASTWNREHVWCQSLSNNNWGESEGGTDILHLRPTYNSVNSSRSNDPYADLNKAYPKYFDTDTLKVTNNSSKMLFGYSDGTWFEPLDAVKGDVARIIMYTWTTYTGWVGNKTYNPLNILSVIESYDTLLRWHTLDKPDVLEGNRNNYCETSLQANRNPFVDHPELAWKIFGDEASAAVKNACMAAYPANGGEQIDPTGVTLNNATANLEVGGTSQLVATIQPNGASGSVTWTSNNTDVATVSNTGLVTAKAVGNAIITARVSESISATCTVTVAAAPEPTHIKVAEYDFSSDNTSNVSEYTSTSTLLTRFNSCDVSGAGLSDIVTGISAASKVYAGFASYYHLGLKFGTSSVNGSFAVTLNREVNRVIVKTAGWETTDGLTIGDADEQVPGVAYNGNNSIKTLTYDITSSNSVTFTYAKRGFIQSIAFYGEHDNSPTPYVNTATTIKTIGGNESVSGGTLSHSASIVFANLSLNNSVQYLDPFEFDDDSTTITFGGGENDGKYYTTGAGIRTYGGGYFTIESPVAITEIQLTWDSNSYKPTSNGVVNVGTYDSSTSVWTGSATSITFTRPSGSGHWRLKSVTATVGGGGTLIVDSVYMRFGATISKDNWNAINDEWPISDYGFMIAKKTTIETTYGVSSVKEAYEASRTLKVVHMNAYEEPCEMDEDNYVFTVKINMTQESNYNVVYCVAPYVVADDEYYFLEEMQYSVNSLAAYCLTNGGSALSNAALKILKGN